jgi:hypothetical protein
MPNLHPILRDTDLPQPLLRPLRFGDPEQIQALRQVDARIEEMIAIADRDGCDLAELRTYAVTFTYEGERTVTVLARNPSEAVVKAEAEFDPGGVDLDVHFVAREVTAPNRGR